MALPGIKIGSTAENVGSNTRMAALIWSASGRGKTTLAGSLHAMTQKYMGKPTLFCAVESGEGGGTICLKDLNIPLWIPKDLNEVKQGIAALRNDKEFGGFVLDSATELYKAFIKPVALKYPCRERAEVVTGPRREGVPAESDYMIMGELARQVIQEVVNLTALAPEFSKHVIVTALDKMRESRGEPKEIIFWGPNLPGQMGTDSAGMFQQVGTIEIKAQVIGGKREAIRYYTTFSTDAKTLKDRYNVLPHEVRLKRNAQDGEGFDFVDMWERYWMPVVNRERIS